MVDRNGPTFVVDIEGLSVRRDERGLRIASLRYFEPGGSFAAAVAEFAGRPLPQPLRATQFERATHDARRNAHRDEHCVFAWRSPTETLLLSNDEIAFTELDQRLAAATDGCVVDQTGGICVFRAQGPRAGDLLVRLGATSALPGLGEARSGRLAELQVLTVCVRVGEYLLLVERVYADHLIEWMGATAADF
jgi:sarcosine oxidase gamma subunit